MPLLILDGRDEGAVHLRAVGFVIVGVVADEHREALGHVHVVGVTVAVFVLIGGIAGLGVDAHLVAHELAGQVVVHGAYDAEGMGVVAGDDEQRVGVGVAEGLRLSHHLVEHDGVVNGALPVQRMRVLVHQTGFQHEEEAVGILGKHLERGVHGIGEVGLIRELGHRALLELLAVERTVEVAGVEQAEQTIRRLFHDVHKLGARGGKRVARLAEVFHIVLLVLALGARNRAGQKIRGAAADEHFGTDVGEHSDNGRLFRTLAGVGHHRGGRGVLDFRVGHDAYGLVRLAAQKLGYVLLTRIVKGILGAVGIHADGVHAGLVTGHVGGSGVGGVGGNGIHAAGAEHAGVGQRVHGKTAVVHAVGHALGKQTRARAVTHAETVGNEQNDVLGLGLVRRAVHVPLCGGFFLAVLRRYRILARGERHVAQNDGRALSFLVPDEFRLCAEHVGHAPAVDAHVDVGLTDLAVELHLEVKLRGPQESRGIHRVNGRGSLRRGGQKRHAETQRHHHGSFHTILQVCFQLPPLWTMPVTCL